MPGSDGGVRVPGCSSHGKTRPKRRRRVLIVDDAEFVRQALRKGFESNGEFEVVCARNGQQALELLRQDKTIDAVVVDISMPILDGRELLRSVSQWPGRRPLMIATGRLAERNDLTECLALGADEALTKPLDIKQLLRIVRDGLRHRCSEVPEKK